MEVVGYKESLMLQLVEPPKILSGEQAFLQGGTNLITPESKEGAVNLVGVTKHPMVVGGKIFMRAEGISRDEGEVQLARSRWRIGLGLGRCS
ncbi:hypothetical protein L195_g054130 [Trifolium pratense]|uniref:Uncharacterized protein n=1 Tax=Trifolium pratense TaxID=57577 RepID=A0A2K3KED2_TRIPR|nr:hypothetical protein L195_g054130 [Trifolium pratense]